MTFLFDDRYGESLYMYAPNWKVAEDLAKDLGYTLIGEYVSTTAPEFLTPGDMVQ